jgi:hypothetical protein
VSVPTLVRRAALSAVLLVALGGARPASAQSRRADVPLPPPPVGTTRVEPVLADPAPSRGPSWIGLSVGAFAAFDRGQSPAVDLDYGFARTPSGWTRWQLEWHLAVSAARPTDETVITRLDAGGASLVSGFDKATVFVAQVVPYARVRYPFVPGFALVVDAGAGVVQTIEKYEHQETFVGASTQTKNVTGLSLRAGLGVSVDLSERTRLVFEPLAYALLLGTDYSAFTPTIGLAYRL